jgi:hypothetical protein
MSVENPYQVNREISGDHGNEASAAAKMLKVSQVANAGETNQRVVSTASNYLPDLHIGSEIKQTANEALSTAEGAVSGGLNWIGEHPGYALGAVCGGILAIGFAPVELTVGGAILVGAAGAAAIDGGAYLIQKGISSGLGLES